MKKLLAIIVALMLLTASVAMAETATVLTIASPVLTVSQQGQSATYDMTGLLIVESAGMAGGTTPTVQLGVVNGDDTLLDAEMQVIDGKMVVAVQGMSQPLAVDLSAAGAQGQEFIGAMFEAMPKLAAMKLPAFPGVTIPKLDLMSLGSMLGATGDGQSATFDIPYEMVQQLLSMLTEYKAVIPESISDQVGPVFDMIDQMNANGMGVALKGTITDDGATGTLAVDVLPVSGGVTASESAATISFISAENQINLIVDVHQGEDTMPLGQIALTSDPAAKELNFSVDIMGGMMNLAGSLYPQDGLQVAALELVAQDQKASISLIYGDKDGANYVDFAFQVEGQAAMECVTETYGDEGNEMGSMTLTADAAGNQFQLDADIMQAVTEDTTFENIADAANAIDVTSLSEEDKAALQEELQGVLGGLMEYFSTLQPAA